MASVAKRKWVYKGQPKEAWVVRYKDRGGQHRSRQFDRKKEADTYCRQVENELEAGTHIARTESRTMSQIFDEYLVDLERRANEKQVGLPYYEQTARALVYAREFMGDEKAIDITWQRVAAYGQHLRRTKGYYTRRLLTASTTRTFLGYLSIVMDYAVRRGYCARNVVPDARKELGAAPHEAIETFSREEMVRLVAAIDDRPRNINFRTQAFLRVIVYLGAMCGMRKGEIMALTWDAIDFDRMEIHVRQSLNMHDVVKGPKTKAGIRTIPLPGRAADALKAFARFIVPEPRGLILRNRNGGGWQDATFYRDLWHPFMRRAGIDTDREYGHRHFHALRHFAGSAWLDAGVPLPEVSRLLGHANMMITARVYSHAVGEISQRAPALEHCAGLLTGAPIAQELRKAA
ncbi:site-specific integrase [Sphingobium sp.]|uniref:tyrosine-type recombinase/integrase n=1 Tax=Sphingobium sp. TaxID=1912891 RepID=UPI0026204FE4|nr:site-specific integrase [Sphingobium sp.]